VITGPGRLPKALDPTKSQKLKTKDLSQKIQRIVTELRCHRRIAGKCIDERLTKGEKFQVAEHWQDSSQIPFEIQG